MKRKKFLYKIEGLLYLLPFLIPYLVFSVFMLIAATGLSFMEFNILGDSAFNGLSNYMKMFKDALFWEALKNTMLYVLLSTPVYIISALFVALLLDAKMLRGRTFHRATFVMPMSLPVSVAATIGLFMSQPYVGLINGLLKTFKILGVDEEIFWLGDSRLVWITITVLTLWWSNGFNIILYLAGLQDISSSYYESAELDGASYWQQVRHITIPLLSRIHVTVLFLQLVASFKIYGQAYIMTGGGPGGASRTYIQYLWENGFRTFDIGVASASSLVLFFIIFVVSALQFTLASKVSD